VLTVSQAKTAWRNGDFRQRCDKGHVAQGELGKRYPTDRSALKKSAEGETLAASLPSPPHPGDVAHVSIE
jgi:hypothetical protein